MIDQLSFEELITLRRDEWLSEKALRTIENIKAYSARVARDGVDTSILDRWVEERERYDRRGKYNIEWRWSIHDYFGQGKVHLFREDNLYGDVHICTNRPPSPHGGETSNRVYADDICKKCIQKMREVMFWILGTPICLDDEGHYRINIAHRLGRPYDSEEAILKVGDQYYSQRLEYVENPTAIVAIKNFTGFTYGAFHGVDPESFKSPIESPRAALQILSNHF